jgi:regulatory protein
MEERERALQIAYRYLDTSPRTRWEVRKKLMQSGFEEDVVEETLNALEGIDLVNDDEFCHRWIESRSSSKGYGKIRLEAELIQRGVDKDVIREALRQLTEEEEITKAFAIARKHLSSEAPMNLKEKRRLFAFLLRRGYNTGIIEKVFTLLGVDND